MTTDNRVPSTPLTCAELDELAGAIALEALPDDEAQRVAAHLQTCTASHAELLELQEVVSLLPLACEQVEPPAALRHRILAEALAPRPALRVLPATAPDAPTRHRNWQMSGVWAAAAALLVAFGFGLWNVQLHGQLNDRYQAGQRAQLQSLLAGRIQPLQPQASGAGISAAVVLADNGHAYLTGTLPALPAGKVYEAWVVTGGQPHPAGTFAVSTAGVPQGTTTSGSAPVQYADVLLTAPVASGQSVAITEEPAGGSATPSESPRAVATLS